MAQFPVNPNFQFLVHFQIARWKNEDWNIYNCIFHFWVKKLWIKSNYIQKNENDVCKSQKHKKIHFEIFI